MWDSLDDRYFPPAELARDDGLLAIGGDLEPDRLLTAYSRGIFPWYEDGFPILWWSPDPRAIVELDQLHVSRRLARTIRSGRFRVTFDAAFEQVMHGCATERDDDTWITGDMIAAYTRLHGMGHAHSVETWRGDRLVGGIYGVHIGGFFAGESMFFREPDASKVALAALVDRLRHRRFQLFDIQMINDHTKSLGATEITRAEYLRRLREAVRTATEF